MLTGAHLDPSLHQNPSHFDPSRWVVCNLSICAIQYSNVFSVDVFVKRTILHAQLEVITSITTLSQNLDPTVYGATYIIGPTFYICKKVRENSIHCHF